MNRVTLVDMNAYARPEATEMAPYYHKYVDRCSGEDVMGTLLDSLKKCRELLARVPVGMMEYRYAPDKWSIKDVVQHVIDAERIFAYRALRIARNDATPLPGFEENDYARVATADARKWEDLSMEMEIVRGATILLFQSMDQEMLMRLGTANNQPASARALGWIISGHMLHHVSVIQERYLSHAHA